MKKTIILFCIAALFASSCSVIENLKPSAPTPIPPTPMPTATPDPCAAENLLEEVGKVQDLVNAFQDSTWLSGFTPQTGLVTPILQLQEIRRDLQKLEVPACEEAIKTSALNYMNSTINYLAFFMAAKTQEELDAAAAGMQNSNVLWQVVLEEFNKLLSSAGLVSDEMPEIGSTVPSSTDYTIIVANAGTQGVNVRSQPELNAEIVTSMEPGMQAIGYSRNEAGDWLLINLDGVVGWVFTEMVSPSGPIEELPISDAMQ
jgi:hypothetical protein